MKNRTCDKCKFAKWQRTKNGRLHRNKEGMCTKRLKMPELPVAFCWLSQPTPLGGLIESGRVHHRECIYFQLDDENENTAP